MSESDQNDAGNIESIDENKLIAQRREKLNAIREQRNAFPNNFRRNDYAADLHEKFGDKDKFNQKIVFNFVTPQT